MSNFIVLPKAYFTDFKESIFYTIESKIVATRTLHSYHVFEPPFDYFPIISTTLPLRYPAR